MNELLNILDVLNNYSSLILVIATGIYVAFTIKLAKETTKLRELETTPFISISFDASFVNIFKLSVKNIGKAPAYNVKFSLDEKYAHHFKYNFTNTISYFAPDQEFTVIASGYQELDKLECEFIPIEVTYESKDKMIIRETFKMEWKYLSQTLVGTDQIENIKKAVEGIEKELNTLTRTIQKKEYVVSTRLKIIELEKRDMYLKFIFSNGYIGKIHNNGVNKLGISNVSHVYIDEGDLFDSSTNMTFKAEEIFHKLTSKKKGQTNV